MKKSDDKSDKENETKQKDLIVYGNTTIFPMIFMDDVANPVKSVEKAQEDIDRMTELMESKLLDLNSDKCCFLLAGHKRGKKRLQKKIDECPLMLYGSPMKQVATEKYLGMQ